MDVTANLTKVNAWLAVFHSSHMYVRGVCVCVNIYNILLFYYPLFSQHIINVLQASTFSK